MTKLNSDQDLQQQINKLSKNKLPERDLWAGIELAISQEKDDNQNDEVQTSKTGQTKWYAMAASVLAVGIVTWMSVQKPVAITGEELVASLSQQHQMQKNALLVRFEDQPALTENWQQQLTELDDAAAAIKKALANEPNNMALLKMLQNVHQQQISLIERVHSPKWSQI